MGDLTSAVALLLGLLTLVLSMASCSSSGPALEGNGVGAQDAGRASLGYAFQRVSRAATWEPVETIPLDFKTFHPQGLVRTKSHLFISSVEILEPPRLDPNAVPGEPDRSEGHGRAHLFKVDPSGRMVQELALGEAARAIYHPGGMGFDGRNLWVPVAQYRPPSVSVIYRVEPRPSRPSRSLKFGIMSGRSSTMANATFSTEPPGARERSTPGT